MFEDFVAGEYDQQACKNLEPFLCEEYEPYFFAAGRESACEREKVKGAALSC